MHLSQGEILFWFPHEPNKLDMCNSYVIRVMSANYNSIYLHNIWFVIYYELIGVYKQVESWT